MDKGNWTVQRSGAGLFPQRGYGRSATARLIRAALRPRAICAGVAFWAVLHIIDRVIAGVVQCATLGCLPNGGGL